MTRHRLRPCHSCITRLTFGSLCAECLASRAHQRSWRSLAVSLIRAVLAPRKGT